MNNKLQFSPTVTDPIKILQCKFYATQFFQDFDWLKILRIQSECLKFVSLNLHCKIFIGLIPGFNFVYFNTSSKCIYFIIKLGNLASFDLSIKIH